MNTLMAEAMRWFGPGDSVSLAEIRQTGATVVYSALHDIQAGEAWPVEAIRARQEIVAAAGLSWDVVESVPVSEAIKTGTGECARHLENYRTTLARLGAAGIRFVGPNTAGFVDFHHPFAATISMVGEMRPFQRGGVAFITSVIGPGVARNAHTRHTLSRFSQRGRAPDAPLHPKHGVHALRRSVGRLL
jgi:hypothetical protein